MEISVLEVHSCHKCFAIFTTQKELDEHLYYHEMLPKQLLEHFLSVTVSLERLNEFKCNDCSQGFPTERELRLHEVKHMKDMVMSNRCKILDEAYEKAEKPYKCEVCDISYVAESTLKMHSVLHEPFPHVCHCGIGYYITADFNNHRKLVHFEAPLPVEQISREDYEKPSLNINKKSNSIDDRQVCRPDTQVGIRKIKKKLKVETQKSENKFVKIGKQFFCSICNKMFSSKKNIIYHQVVHTGEKPFECKICYKTYAHGAGLRAHLKKHGEVRNFACTYCDKKFFDRYGLKRHTFSHTREKVLQCEVCHKEFSDPSGYLRHVRIHTSEKTYQCNICPEKFNLPIALANHKLQHEGIKNFICSICNKAFYMATALRKHMQRHTKEKKFQCHDCSKFFPAKNNLIQHITRVHIQKKNFECNICGYKFCAKGELRRHVDRVHEKLRNYVCKSCGKWFSTKQHLENHYNNIHEPNYHFDCDYCLKEYKAKRSLTRHIIKRHMNIQCDVCMAYFSCNSMLVDHKRSICKGTTARKSKIVMKIKMYECYKCFRRFPVKSQLKKHCIQFHGGGQESHYICNECGSEFKLRHMLLFHIHMSHMTIYPCEYCPCKFYSESSFAKHREVCVKPEPSQFEVC